MTYQVLKSLYALFVVSMLCISEVAEANSITVGPVTTPIAPIGSFNETVALPKFNPALGTLDSISLTFSLTETSSGSFTVQAYDSSCQDGCYGPVDLWFSFRLLRPDSSPLVDVSAGQVPLGWYHFFTQPRRFPFDLPNISMDLLIDIADFNLFTGTGMNTLTVQGWSDVHALVCCGSAWVDNPPNVFGSVTATYNFTSVSEPSILILFGLGIIGLLGYNWRHRVPCLRFDMQTIDISTRSV